MSKNDYLNRLYIDVSTFVIRFGNDTNYVWTHNYLLRLASYVGDSFERLKEGYHPTYCLDLYSRAYLAIKPIIEEIDPDTVEDYFKNRKVYSTKEGLETITNALAAGFISPEDARAMMYEI